jgi:Trk K+ transport system NAD-binding subunit
MIPATVNVLAIKRGEVYITPNGATKLMAHDTLYVLAENKTALKLLGETLDIKYTSNSFENFSI